jgi:hypothetical protein
MPLQITSMISYIYTKTHYHRFSSFHCTQGSPRGGKEGHTHKDKGHTYTRTHTDQSKILLSKGESFSLRSQEASHKTHTHTHKHVILSLPLCSTCPPVPPLYICTCTHRYIDGGIFVWSLEKEKCNLSFCLCERQIEEVSNPDCLLLTFLLYLLDV